MNQKVISLVPRPRSGSSLEGKKIRSTLYAGLAEEIKTQILQGVFVAGQRLPSVRALALSKKISINTVQEAFRVLEDEQWIVVRTKSGAYVAPRFPDLATQPQIAPVSPVLRFVANSGPASALAYRDDLIPFGAAVPHASFFPCARLALGIAALLRKNPTLIGTYNFAPGSVELRQQLARRAVEWGANVDPRRVIVTNGAVEAIHLCLRAVTKPGDTIAVEAPAYYGFLQAAQLLDLTVQPIPSNLFTGLDLAVLEQTLASQKISAILLSTTVSNPTGSTMPLAAKRRLVELAVQYEIPIIEDATFADLHFDGECQAAQGFDESGLVMLCASLTKTIAPGLRLGWVDAGRYTDQVAHLKRVSSVGQPKILELALADYMRSGGMTKRLRSMRKAMQAQVYQTAKNVEEIFPNGTEFALPTGGFLLWVSLPSDVDTLILQEQAVKLGIGVAPGAIFSPNGAYRNFIRLNCGVPDLSIRTSALTALAHLIDGIATSTSERPTEREG